VSPLSPGDPFPALNVPLAGGGRLELPGALAGSYGVVLFYRGSWCPYCNAQLRAFQRAEDSLRDASIRVAALSVDDEATAQALIDKHHLSFPVGHSADARQVARLTGAFLNEDPLYIQSTGFVLDPAGTVMISVYSSGAIGRLVPDDVLGVVRYARAPGRINRPSGGSAPFSGSQMRLSRCGIKAAFRGGPVCRFSSTVRADGTSAHVRPQLRN
jgi:peroxiredoxin